MKNSLLFLVFMWTLGSARAADTLKILNHDDFRIEESISDKEGTQEDKLKLILKLKGQKRDTSITVLLPEGSFESHPKLKKSDFKIAMADWKADTAVIELTIITNTTKQAQKEGATTILYLKDHPESFITVKLASSHKYDPGKAFWVEAGANLDLIDGLQANNLFSGVFMYKRDIRPSSLYKRGTEDNLGIFAGVYESKTLSSRSEDEFRIFTYYNNSSLYHPDSMWIYTDTGRISVKQQIRNVGLFFSPQIRLTNHSANEEGLHLFVSFWAELQWQRITNSIDFGNVRRRDSASHPRYEAAGFSSLPKTEEADIRSHYIGLGLPVFYKAGDANLFFNPVIGASNQPTENDLRSLTVVNDRAFKKSWHLFYLLQFRLSEEKYGFAFSGEVRGLLIDNSRPFVTLVLSKKFDLSKLIEFR